VGGHPPPPRGDAARAGGQGAEPERGGHRHPERQDDGKGGPRGYDAAKKVKGRKRHVAVDTAGLLLGVAVHAADIQDADGAGDLLRRLKRLYPWLKAVFADGAYCVVPEYRGALISREGEDALWQQVFTAQPARRREFEPSSKRRKKRPAPWPPATG
jgi:hypothetical protein